MLSSVWAKALSIARVRRGREKGLYNGSINTSFDSQEQTAYTLNGGHQIVMGAKIGASGHHNIWSLATFRGTAGCDVILHLLWIFTSTQDPKLQTKNESQGNLSRSRVYSYLIAYLVPPHVNIKNGYILFTMTVELITITVGVPNSAKWNHT